jgi:hypothetical protein
MKLLLNTTDYKETINSAINLLGEYSKTVIFHCYWNGVLNEKHLYSILSCYYFNCYKNKHKIILWLENNRPNQYNTEIEKYAEIRYFSISYEIKETNFVPSNVKYNRNNIAYGYSEVVRYLLLYNYGGLWFDLDCFFLRNFDPLFYNFENEICVYQWENQNYPNCAIFISLEPKCEKMKKNIQFIIERNRGWVLQEASITYELPLDMLVLPCSWFDASWLPNPYNIGTENFFEYTGINYHFDNFFKGSFCYHWHNKWNKKIEDNSIFIQLVKIIQNNLLQ